jgi:hypothetical protein
MSKHEEINNMLSNDDWLEAIDELSKMSDEEKSAFGKAVVEEVLAERLQNGEIEIVETNPDGTQVYQFKPAR